MLRDLLDVICTAYLDDILIYSTDELEHEAHVVTGRQGKGTRSDQCILIKTIVVVRRREEERECGKRLFTVEVG